MINYGEVLYEVRVQIGQRARDLRTAGGASVNIHPENYMDFRRDCEPALRMARHTDPPIFMDFLIRENCLVPIDTAIVTKHDKVIAIINLTNGEFRTTDVPENNDVMVLT